MSTSPAVSRSDALFAPPASSWERISPRYLKLKLIGIFIWWPILIAASAVIVWFAVSDSWPGHQPLFWGVIALGVAILAWRAIRMPFFVRRWGFAERDEDVYITYGLAFRNLVCVPYGRMQLVTVTAGPIERALKLATVRMVTAATGANVMIPGLEREQAEAVRDRFINRGEHLQAGI